LTKTKKTTILLLISLLIMSAIILLFSGNNYTNIAFADSTRGNLGGVGLSQDVYSEDSDTGSSWGESDHTSYDGHIRFTAHNAASFIGYDLTNWTMSTVISGENTYVIIAVNNYGFTTTETVIITHKYIVTSRKVVNCTEQGYTVYKCITCNESIVSDYVNALGHNYDSLVIPPTCTERGYTLNSCTRCDHTTMTNYVNALGHSYTSQTIEATCTENGCILD